MTIPCRHGRAAIGRGVAADGGCCCAQRPGAGPLCRPLPDPPCCRPDSHLQSHQPHRFGPPLLSPFLPTSPTPSHPKISVGRDSTRMSPLTHLEPRTRGHNYAPAISAATSTACGLPHSWLSKDMNSCTLVAEGCIWSVMKAQRWTNPSQIHYLYVSMPSSFCECPCR